MNDHGALFFASACDSRRPIIIGAEAIGPM
jgi:hypothetical protein